MSAEQAVRDIHAALDAMDVSLSRNRVVRIARDYVRHSERTGWSLMDYLMVQLELTAEQVLCVTSDPDLAYIWPHGFDKTGENAVAHVMRERGY